MRRRKEAFIIISRSRAEGRVPMLLTVIHELIKENCRALTCKAPDHPGI